MGNYELDVAVEDRRFGELMAAQYEIDLAGATEIVLTRRNRLGPTQARSGPAVRRARCASMRLRVAKKGDPTYNVFVNSLVEDKSTAGMSYVEFLCHVHRQIQEKMS